MFLDFQLTAVLREVKYLETAQNDTLEIIPDSATTIYSRNETFHKFCANLDLTVAWYNKVRETLLDVEFPLVEGQLQNIDNQLEQAEKSLNWNSDGKRASFIKLTSSVVQKFGGGRKEMCPNASFYLFQVITSFLSHKKSRYM